MLNRRELLKNSAFLSAIAALGIKPGQVLAADENVLKVRMEADIQVLDPGYMIGGAETSIQFACLPRLAGDAVNLLLNGDLLLPAGRDEVDPSARRPEQQRKLFERSHALDRVPVKTSI